MMKQTRIIRISFLICTICMVAAFWSGFYFGESQLKADTAPVQTASCPDTDSKKSSTEEKKNISGTDSVESMNHLSEEIMSKSRENICPFILVIQTGCILKPV